MGIRWVLFDKFHSDTTLLCLIHTLTIFHIIRLCTFHTTHTIHIIHICFFHFYFPLFTKPDLLGLAHRHSTIGTAPFFGRYKGLGVIAGNNVTTWIVLGGKFLMMVLSSIQSDCRFFMEHLFSSKVRTILPEDEDDAKI